MSAVSTCDNSTLWVTLRTGPATEEPHFCVASSLTGPAHSHIGPYAQLSASSPHMISAMDGGSEGKWKQKPGTCSNFVCNLNCNRIYSDQNKCCYKIKYNHCIFIIQHQTLI